jgi:chitodextrinase
MTTARSSWRTAVQALLVTIVCGSSLLSAQGFRRDRTPPTAPTNLTVISVTEHSVTLSWGPSTDNSGRFTYLICCVSGNVAVPQTQTTYTIEGLQSGKTYVFRVYAWDAAGNTSKSSNAASVTLPGQIAAPTKPGVQVLDVGPTHARLSWSSTDDGTLIWYTIFVDGQAVRTLNSRSFTFTCASVAGPTYCIPFEQETTYVFTVQARDVDGNRSPTSDPVAVRTAPAPDDHTPPTSPTNIIVDGIGGFSIVSWDASTDDIAEQRFIRYDISVDGELRTVVVGATTAEVETDFGDEVITIIAIDTADNESAPAWVALGS